MECAALPAGGWLSRRRGLQALPGHQPAFSSRWGVGSSDVVHRWCTFLSSPVLTLKPGRLEVAVGLPEEKLQATGRGHDWPIWGQCLQSDHMCMWAFLLPASVATRAPKDPTDTEDSPRHRRIWGMASAAPKPA